MPETRRGSYEESGGEKTGRKELLEKAARDEHVFIPGRESGLADEACSDTIPDAAGGE
jgi:hypothetical protein